VEDDRPTRLLTVFIIVVGLAVVGLLTALVVLVSVDRNSGGRADAAATSSPATTATTMPTTTTTSTTTTTTSTTTTTTSTTTTTVPDDADRGVEAAGEPFGDFALLTDVRVARREEGVTRVVFDFAESDVAPWWRVDYAEGPFIGSGGPPVDIDGDAFLRVTLSSSTVDLSGADVRTVYDGPDRIEAGTGGVVELAMVEDFEGVLVWVIGLEGGEHPFTVDTLTDPPRVYVDIADGTR
jgi:hypothetical protein